MITDKESEDVELIWTTNFTASLRQRQVARRKQVQSRLDEMNSDVENLTIAAEEQESNTNV